MQPGIIDVVPARLKSSIDYLVIVLIISAAIAV